MAQQGTAASAGRAAAPSVNLSLFYQVIEKDDESFWPRGEEEEEEEKENKSRADWMCI